MLDQIGGDKQIRLRARYADPDLSENLVCLATPACLRLSPANA